MALAIKATKLRSAYSTLQCWLLFSLGRKCCPPAAKGTLKMTEWVKFLPLIPRRTVDGGWTIGNGTTWRRKVAGKWEYKQEPETEEEFKVRQW
jgi:hypothetical protein